MKSFSIMRYLRYSFVFLLFAGFLYSCSGIIPEPEPVIEPQNEPQTEPVADSFDTYILHASYAGGAATKTEFGDRTTTNSYAQIYWSEGDAINVFYTEGNDPVSACFVTSGSGQKADFVNQSDIDPSGSRFFGLYPYDQSAVADFGASNITTTIPSSQDAYNGKFDPKALLAVGVSSKVDEMAFYNVCGGLCFTLKNSAKYSRIDFSGNNNEDVAGAMIISLKDPSVPVATAAGQGSSKVVSLTRANGEKFVSGTEYFIMIRPGEFKYGFKLQFFEPQANSASKTETCSSYVVFKRGIFACVEEVDNGKLGKIRDGEDLSVNGETANCYIVSSAGSYKFPLVKGNDSEHVISGVTKVAALWETDNTSGSQTAGSIIKDVAFNGSYVYFNTPSTLKNGNAVIAAYSGNKIVWSWHVWVCSGYNAQTSSVTLKGKTKPMMDRNLGALSNASNSALSNGFFYQWGRKDPFPGAIESYVSADGGAGTYMSTTAGALKTAAASNNGTVDYTIANPNVFITSTDGYWLIEAINSLWGITISGGVETAVKSVYDPCPPGWKVPRARVMSNGQHVVSEEAWAGFGTNDLNWGPQGRGISLPLATDGETWYPNNGYISREGKVIMVGQYSCYWSCTPYGGGMSYAMQMSRDMSGTLQFNGIQYGKLNGEGHSVRCIKDN